MIRNTRESWGWPTRALHWIVAAMVIGLFVHGLWMEDLGSDARAFNIWLHCAVGISLLAIAAAACVWWRVNAVPAEPTGMPAWQSRAARLAHWGLYALIFAATIAGWVLTGTMRDPVAIQLFGFIDVPQLIGPGSGFHKLFEEGHELAAYLLIALAAVHAAAALYHHFVLHDAVLLRMLGRKPNHESDRSAGVLRATPPRPSPGA
jgi:cytochrome b561